MCALICLQFSGETFSTIVHDGTLTVKRDGNGVSIDVSVWGTAWMPGRSFAACRKKTAQGLLVHACIHSARQLNFSNDWSNSAVASADTALLGRYTTPEQLQVAAAAVGNCHSAAQRRNCHSSEPTAAACARPSLPTFLPSCACPQVAGNAVAWVPSAHGGPFKRVDMRSFQVATTDLMGSYYVTLPKGEARGNSMLAGSLLPYSGCCAGGVFMYVTFVGRECAHSCMLPAGSESLLLSTGWSGCQH